MAAAVFASPSPDKHAQDEGLVFAPRFDRDGLVTAIVVDAADNAVLMVAHMNAEALRLTLESGFAHYWSRSRQKLWKKGETSGNLQKVVEMQTDCDQDAVLVRVDMTGAEAACHTGRRSCFYRRVRLVGDEATLEITDDSRRFDPSVTYAAD